jgi:hypothetical protein
MNTAAPGKYRSNDLRNEFLPCYDTYDVVYETNAKNYDYRWQESDCEWNSGSHDMPGCQTHYR